MLTRQEVRYQVDASLTDHSASFDVEGITETLWLEYNLTASIDEVDTEEYWAIIQWFAL